MFPGQTWHLRQVGWVFDRVTIYCIPTNNNSGPIDDTKLRIAKPMEVLDQPSSIITVPFDGLEDCWPTQLERDIPIHPPTPVPSFPAVSGIHTTIRIVMEGPGIARFTHQMSVYLVTACDYITHFSPDHLGSAVTFANAVVLKPQFASAQPMISFAPVMGNYLEMAMCS